MKHSHMRGFTLVELSIVMVIIAALAGAIVVGQGLIEAAQLKNIINDYNKYNTVVQTFKSKYNYLPGDLPNATQYWGAAGGGATDNYTQSCFNASSNTPNGSTATCNGNGNGYISGGPNCSNVNFFLATCDDEQYAVWHQLANAGLDNGIYISFRSGNLGGADPTLPYWVRGKGGNMPSSKGNAKEGFFLTYMCNPGNNTLFPGCSHYFFYGAQSEDAYHNYADFPMRPALTAAEALAIDMKMDDGKPGTGAVMAPKNGSAWFSGSCTTTNVASTSAYTTASGKLCALQMKSVF